MYTPHPYYNESLKIHPAAFHSQPGLALQWGNRQTKRNKTSENSKINQKGNLNFSSPAFPRGLFLPAIQVSVALSDYYRSSIVTT